MGGADTGGGAGVGGKMLESYRVRINETPEFKSRIQPIINALAVKDVSFAADLMHIALRRQWYILPTNLAKIPASDMIATVPGHDVEQVAIQTGAEVWIDKRIYAQWKSDARVELIVHELVMGVRMMEYQNPYEQCLAAAAVHYVKDELEAYDRERRQCAFKRMTDFSPRPLDRE
ncbi:MAG: hypothetical protein HC902_00520 [Calothrix sp. SM1_5_4]|nr:hypothetical protein [Calothrix sp. SM1_5_4]